MANKPEAEIVCIASIEFGRTLGKSFLIKILRKIFQCNEILRDIILMILIIAKHLGSTRNFQTFLESSAINQDFIELVQL